MLVLGDTAGISDEHAQDEVGERDILNEWSQEFAGVTPSVFHLCQAGDSFTDQRHAHRRLQLAGARPCAGGTS